jgi:hypothetical protein
MKNTNGELDLETLRPRAGSTKKLPTGEVLFLSPLPVPTGQIPADLNGSFTEVNDVYLDFGSTNSGKAFQTQIMIANVMLVFLFFFIFTPFIAGSTAWGNPHGVSFWSRAESVLNYTFPLAIGLTITTALIAVYVIIGSTLRKSKTRPLRFNRQRREICYFPKNSNTPIIRPWEETITWLSASISTTGVGIIKTFNLGIAIEDKANGLTHYINNTAPSIFHGLSQWEAIRSYMEYDTDYFPEKVAAEGRDTFDKKIEEFRNEKKSITGKLWWILTHVISWWKVPYLIAEWDHKYSMKPMPECIINWSEPLPKTQWTPPSEALVEQSRKMKTAFTHGQDFISYFKASFKD